VKAFIKSYQPAGAMPVATATKAELVTPTAKPASKARRLTSRPAVASPVAKADLAVKTPAKAPSTTWRGAAAPAAKAALATKAKAKAPAKATAVVKEATAKVAAKAKKPAAKAAVVKKSAAKPVRAKAARKA
jgi:hypothetical protein